MLDSDIDPALGVVHAREWHFGALLFRKRVRHRVRRVDPTVRVEYIFRNVSVDGDAPSSAAAVGDN